MSVEKARKRLDALKLEGLAYAAAETAFMIALEEFGPKTLAVCGAKDPHSPRRCTLPVYLHGKNHYDENFRCVGCGRPDPRSERIPLDVRMDQIENKQTCWTCGR